MFIINIIILLFFNNCICKTIILSLKRISYEKDSGRTLIDDYINYDIYTEILMGTPSQKVTLFIEPNDSTFQFKKISLQYNNHKFKESLITKFQENNLFLFNSTKSSTYKGYYSDNFILTTDNNKTIEISDFKFTIYLNNRDEKEKYGIIGLFTMILPSFVFADIFSFVNQLKDNEIIDDYVFTFIYNNINENNDIFFENSENFGKIVVGEYAPSFLSDNILKKEEEIKIYSSSSTHWGLMFDEIKFNYNNEKYMENHIEANFDFFSKFIKGSYKYNETIYKLFFNSLINENLCQKEIISENKYTNKYEIYWCNNTNIVNEKIKKFPPLYLTIKSDNLNFIFNYNDLFKLYDNKLYFMIIFPFGGYNSKTNTWLIGEIFMSKFICTFNLEAKSISFYKGQINKANNFKVEKNEKKKLSNTARNIIEIIMLIIIIICIYLIYRKYRKSRKILANELEDGNYAYIPKEKKENQLINEKELNKV